MAKVKSVVLPITVSLDDETGTLVEVSSYQDAANIRQYVAAGYYVPLSRAQEQAAIKYVRNLCKA